MTHTHKLDPNDITAPTQQFALIGQSYTLQCNSIIKDAFISWRQNNNMFLPSHVLSSVELSDERTYECRVSVMGASIKKPVQLNVIGIQLIITRCMVYMPHVSRLLGFGS